MKQLDWGPPWAPFFSPGQRRVRSPSFIEGWGFYGHFPLGISADSRSDRVLGCADYLHQPTGLIRGASIRGKPLAGCLQTDRSFGFEDTCDHFGHLRVEPGLLGDVLSVRRFQFFHGRELLL
jgi:hypothetical protein